MKDSPPENEKGSVITGASLSDLEFESTESGIVNQSGTKVKPVLGAGFVNGELVPSVLHSSDQPEPYSESETYRRLSVVLDWINNDSLSVKWHAALIALGQSTLTPNEVAGICDVSPRLVQIRIAEVKKVLAESGGE